MSFELDHIDIVTTHRCNKKCPHCIDKFIRTSCDEVSLDSIDKFLKLIKSYTDKQLEVLLLGGEPTVLSFDKLVDISNLIHSHGFLSMMSTNGVLKEKIIKLTPYYDFIQVTVDNDSDIDFYRMHSGKINIKWVGDDSLTLDTLKHFEEYTRGFLRRSISMYFTPDFKELCTDKELWDFLDTLEWKRNGSYMYTFYNGVRIKKCIHGKTNIIDEPEVPKLYPNGNYNKTWNNEDMDDYLSR